jgi:hypothetical protein
MKLTDQWKKSIRSQSDGNCVEVRLVDGQVQVRDSKNPDGGALGLDPEAWRAFLASMR